MKATILIIEDEKCISELLGDVLELEGFDLLFAHDGVEGLRVFERHRPDLVLTDILMPRMDGRETCRRIREISDVPIIILSCKIDEADIARGLELGADDYVCKPFSKVELVARIRAALRRRRSPLVHEGPVQIDERLTLDRTRCRALVEGRAVDLSATECRLLTCLVDNAGCISTHRSLLTQVWGWEYAEQTDYLKVYVYHLRRKIEVDPCKPQYIRTERGLGYRFQMPEGP
jgi:two-component system KDP operon response regulator KdpE